MIKNESKIIERCLGRALEHIDAVSILDTGSTDNTVEVCEKYLSACGKPYKINVEPFKNFGYNRTVSYEKAQEFCKELGWDTGNTYAMAVDADMIIKPSAEFKNFKMTVAGYRVMQQNSSIKYYNNRFMRCNYNWKCVGSTHEYWDGEGAENIPYEIFFIDDINDGGCKSDKFERDIRLLTEDLKKNSKNGRSHFYLAQSYRDSGKITEAIKHYKERIRIGGWIEEVWYSYYQIAKCYERLKEPEKMEAWALKAFKFHPKRAEPLYFLVRHFKDKYEHYKAYQYYLKARDIPFPKDDILFIEHNIYNGMLEYENTIVSSYLLHRTKQDGLADMVKYINNNTPYFIDNVWDNIHFYVETLTSATYRGNYTPLLFPDVDEYKVSSCSMIPYEDKLLMNTRYVNYGVDGKGGYPVRSADGIVRTKNGLTFLNKNYCVLENPSILTENLGTIFENNSPYGLEDVRIFNHKGTIYFNANSKNFKENNNISMVIGEYNINKKTIDNVKVVESPYGKTCEKNWIYIPLDSNDKMNFIYNWCPLEIGAVDNGTLNIYTKHNTPKFFSRLRGSSNMFEYNSRLWCLTHYVKYSTPRIYYHSLIAFNRQTLKPEMYSLPFAFRKLAIEYCLTIHIKDGDICFIFSQGDSEPGIITMPLNNLRFLQV
jgi:tetratricopeptide (TPR) repeat protein